LCIDFIARISRISRQIVSNREGESRESEIISGMGNHDQVEA